MEHLRSSEYYWRPERPAGALQRRDRYLRLTRAEPLDPRASSMHRTSQLSQVETSYLGMTGSLLLVFDVILPAAIDQRRAHLKGGLDLVSTMGQI